MADTEEAKELRKLIKAIQQFTLLNPKMSAQTILAFLHVAVDEGKSLSDYVAASRLPQSTISRQLNDLGRLNRDREEGLMLVDDRFAPESLKEKQKFLTPKGKELVKRVLKALS
jgi:DNA-binding MarR family transcriptional regulator